MWTEMLIIALGLLALVFSRLFGKGPFRYLGQVMIRGQDASAEPP